MLERSSPRRDPRVPTPDGLRRRIWVGMLSTLVAFGGLAGITAVPASAAPAEVAAPSSAPGAVNYWSPISGVSISGFESPTVRVDVSVEPSSQGLVRYTGTPSGVTAVPGFANVSGGLAHIAFTGALADVNAALAALQFRGSAAGSATIKIDAVDPPAIYNAEASGGNGHFYRVISSSTPVTATDAVTYAAASTILVNGVTYNGYLATITSAQENTFLAQRALTYGWIGASDAETEGTWKWTTGPEANTVFCTGNNPCNAQAGRYRNWAASEPNDYSPGEDYAVINWGGNGSGTWNDLPGTYTGVYQYIVEYSGPGGAALPAATSASASIAMTITAPTVPGAPTAANATAGGAQATVSWTAPTNDGGMPVTSYTVTASPGGATCTATAPATSCTVTGLTNGTAYTFSVRATNVVGQSAASSASNSVTPLGVPGAPTAVSATRGDGQLAVVWTAPANNGGTAITSYTATAAPGGATCTATAPATGCTMLGLTNGTAYTVTVTATNAVGTGPASSASAARVPAAVPDPPSAVTTVRGNAQLDVLWSAPANNGAAITSYTATAAPGGATCTATAPATGCTILGLTNGTAYTVTVTATNAVGASAASLSSPPLVPATVPGAPSAVEAVRGPGEATVSWTAPANNGGSVITSYTVAASPGGAMCSAIAPATSCTVPGLTNGIPYTFVVTATNDAGTGTASGASSPATPATVPTAPAGVSTVRGNGQVTVTWSAPAYDGGSIITSYTATASPGGATCTATAPDTACVIDDLANGTSYTVTVTAANAVGTGPASIASAAVVPATIPGAPAEVGGSSEDGGVYVWWTPPLNDGGAAITSYTVVASDGGTCTATPSEDGCWIDGLANGTPYTFAVSATNEIGPGAPTTSAVIVPAGAPTSPSAVTVQSGDGSLVVSWTEGSSNGTPITSYTVTVSPGGATCTVAAPATSCTVHGLTNGEAYSVTVVANSGAGTSTSAVSAEPVAPVAPAGYQPLPQARLVDTRLSSISDEATPNAGGIVQASLGGAAIPAETTAVLVNLTGVNATDAGYVTVYPCGSPTPLASSLNVTPGRISANLAMVRVPVGTTALCARTSTNVDVVIDLVGAFSGALPDGVTDSGDSTSLARAPFLPATPARLVDTRTTGGRLLRHAFAEVNVKDDLNFPEDATAVVLNVTTDRAAEEGYVTVYSCADGRPGTSTLNLDPSGATANLAVVPVHDGRVCIYTQGETDVIVDLVGSFAPSHDSVLTATDHQRVLDTREGLGAPSALAPHDTLVLDVANVVASGTTAVALNVTSTNSAEAGWVRVWACGTPMPPTSNLNPAVGRAVPSMVLTSVGTGANAGKVCIMSHAPTDLVVDVQGWFTEL